MRLRKPLTETICQACTHRFSCNDNEVSPNVVRCPRCGFETEVEYPPAYEEELGCGPLIGIAAVLFVITLLFGGGGIVGALLGIVLGIGFPIGLAVLAYHLIRATSE